MGYLIFSSEWTNLPLIIKTDTKHIINCMNWQNGNHAAREAEITDLDIINAILTLKEQRNVQFIWCEVHKEENV